MKTRWLDKDKDLEIRKELNEKFNLYFPDKNGNKRDITRRIEK